MTINRKFDQIDEATARQRAIYLPASWDWDRFMTWLDIAENQQKLALKYGPDWTLNQALDMLSAPAIPKRSQGAALKRLKTAKRSLKEDVPNLSNPDMDPNEMASTAEMELPTITTLPTIDPAEAAEQIERRIQEIIEHTEDIQTWDEPLLRTMVSCDVLAEKYLQRLSTETNVGMIGDLIGAIEKLNKRSSELQKVLRIDRSTRQQDAEKMSDADKVTETIRAAGEYALKQCFQVIHCGILVGWVYTAFKERPIKVEFTCPRCGVVVVEDHVPTAEEIAAATEPEWVKDEEESYTEGVEDESKLPEDE